MEETRLNETLPRPPGVLGALRAGFDATASHIGVLFLPLAVDLAIWLGPRVRIEQLIAPFLPGWSELSAGPYTPAEILANLQQMSANWNLLSLLRTFPVGVPSLMSWINVQEVVTPGMTVPAATPLGAPLVLQAGSALEVLGWLSALVLLGWLLGSLYFTWVARISLGPAAGGLREAGKALLLSMFWVALACALAVPAMVLFSVIALISVTLAQALVFGVAIFGLWIILPVFFSPHGIFTGKQGVLRAVSGSLRMMRFSFSNSGFFLLISVALGHGFNSLWSVPAANSWLLLVGIAGHAFITTALLAASFIYYRDLCAWGEKVLAQLRARALARQA
jgi:hypothetical protein